jgi:hypothetical protein
MAAVGAGSDPALRGRLFEEARSWRGARIPHDPGAAADFTWWMLESGFFSRMLDGNLDRQVQDEESRVLGPDGVAEFWDLAVSV